MSQTATRLRRLLDIVFLIRGTPGLRAEDLAARFSISKKRVFDDLRDLKKAGISIDYSDGGYNLPDGLFDSTGAFAPEEALILLVALRQIASTTDIEEEMITRLTAKILPPSHNRLLECIERVDSTGHATGPLSNVAKTAALSDLEAAALSLEQVRLLYKSRKDMEATWRNVHPYAVIHRRNAWYLIAYHIKHREVRTFKVSRVEDVQPLHKSFKTIKGFSMEDFLRKRWEIYSGEPFLVLVAFDRVVSYLVTEKTAPHAKVWEDGERVYLQALIGDLDEFVRWLLPYGAHAEVIQPPALRSRIQSVAEEILNTYDDGKESQ